MPLVAPDPYAGDPFIRGPYCRTHPLGCPPPGTIDAPPAPRPVPAARVEPVPVEPPAPTRHEAIREATRAKRRRAT